MRLALFGGTFDPVHNGHLEIARRAADELGLDRVLFVTSCRPPHKRDREHADYENRTRMVELACESEPRFEASRLEAPDEVSADASYSVHTIKRVHQTLGPDDRLFFLMGADAFGDLRIWYRLEDVLPLVEFIVAARPGGGQERAPDRPGLRVHWIRTTDNPISATEIRRRAAAGEPLDGLTPTAVADYIREKGLYHAGSETPSGRTPR